VNDVPTAAKTQKFRTLHRRGFEVKDVEIKNPALSEWSFRSGLLAVISG
jgi:hypothetical protein